MASSGALYRSLLDNHPSTGFAFHNFRSGLDPAQNGRGLRLAAGALIADQP